jgi:hypothetical protein
MTANRWAELCREIWSQPPGFRAVQKPEEGELDAFECEINSPLPPSYREFILMFGPGELAQEFMIFAPICPGNKHFDMRKFNNHFRQAFDKCEVLQNSYKEPQLIRRLVFFGRNIGNDYFGWDPEETAKKANPEYQIHFLQHLAESTRIIAASFEKFILEICLGNKYYSIYSATGDRSLEGPRRSFTPAISRSRKKT